MQLLSFFFFLYLPFYVFYYSFVYFRKLITHNYIYHIFRVPFFFFQSSQVSTDSNSNNLANKIEEKAGDVKYSSHSLDEVSAMICSTISLYGVKVIIVFMWLTLSPLKIYIYWLCSFFIVCMENIFSIFFSKVLYIIFNSIFFLIFLFIYLVWYLI